MREIKVKKVKTIVVDQIGAIFSSDGEIIRFGISGEMALVDWYRQGDREFNGKYVISVEYEGEEA